MQKYFSLCCILLISKIISSQINTVDKNIYSSSAFNSYSQKILDILQPKALVFYINAFSTDQSIILNVQAENKKHLDKKIYSPQMNAYYFPPLVEGAFCNFEDFINKKRKLRIDFGTD